MTGARNVWLGNDAWPSNKSCAQFARDVFRISGAKTDKEKALAFYDWLTRCMMRGPNLLMPDSAGGYSRAFDPLTLLTSWGHGECTFWGWVAVECLNGAGLKSRRVVCHNNGHTYYEVWYAGDDGVEQWHAFDPFGGWFFLNENGEVASAQQLAENPQLAQNPLPGHPVPLGHHPERNNMGHRHRTEDQVFIEQPLFSDENSWGLKKGMEVTVLFIPESPNKALFTRHPKRDEFPVDNHPNGSHCDITELSREGFRQKTEHLPYWENYMWPTPDTSHLNEGRPVRWHGSGALRWKPLQYGADVAYETHHMTFENGRIFPDGRHNFAEVWYHFKLPFLVSFINVDYDIIGSGGDYWGLTLSADDRKTMWPLKTRSHSPHYGTASNGQAQWKAGESSVQGLKEFWLRVDMFSHHPNVMPVMQAMNVSVGFQHNMHVQPRLLPGDNPLWLSAGEIDAGCELTAEWIYMLDGDEHRVSLSRSGAGTSKDTVTLDAARPADIRMSSIKLALT